MFAVGLAVGLGRPAAAGALLAALYGLGNLAGSFLVTVVPLRGDPDRTVLRFSSVVALTFAACGLAPSYPLAVAAFVAGGLVNGPFFATTLAARTEYAPPGGTRSSLRHDGSREGGSSSGRRSHRRAPRASAGPGRGWSRAGCSCWWSPARSRSIAGPTRRSPSQPAPGASLGSSLDRPVTATRRPRAGISRGGPSRRGRRRSRASPSSGSACRSAGPARRRSSSSSHSSVAISMPLGAHARPGRPSTAVAAGPATSAGTRGRTARPSARSAAGS